MGRSWQARGTTTTVLMMGALVLLTGAGCKRKGPPLPVWTGGDAAAALPALPSHSSGCARSEPPPTGHLERTLRVAGHDRRYQMVVPPGARADQPLPVV